MDRRTFHRLCGGLIAGAGALHRELAAAAPPGDAAGPWPRTRLLDTDDAPLTLASLAPGESLVFHYPYRVTPCFLVRLDPADAVRSGVVRSGAAPSGTGAAGGRDAADDGGTWPGGLGDDSSLVAFSAICSHKMSHPARPISHIAYRAEPVEFTGPDGARHTRSGTISCCSERSVYDPADGARVLAGPAPVPLAAIELAVDGGRHDRGGGESRAGSLRGLPRRVRLPARPRARLERRSPDERGHGRRRAGRALLPPADPLLTEPSPTRLR